MNYPDLKKARLRTDNDVNPPPFDVHLALISRAAIFVKAR
jgi:hypothetical protein